MRLRSFVLPCLAVLIGGCSEATRSLGSLTQRAEAPPLYKIERDFITGAFSTAKSVPAPRIALVIGNQRYDHVEDLINPVSDAGDIADLLRETGHRVIEANNLTKRGFEKTLRDLAIEAGTGGEVLVFYAGHGFQVDGTDYLVPVDAALTDETDLPFQTVRVETLFRLMEARSRRHISFLDACRNNPFAEALVRVSLSDRVATPELGFRQYDVPGEGLVVYSTGPGALAYDGKEGDNSPFSAALIDRVRQDPDGDLTQVLAKVRRDVSRKTKGEQVPTWVTKIDDPIALALPQATQAKISLAEAVGADTAATTSVIVAKAVPEADLAQGTAPLRIEVPRERTIALGARIAAALRLPGSATVTLEGAPVHGSLSVATEAGNLLERSSIAFNRATAGSVFYRLGADQVVSKTAFAGSNVVEDMLMARISGTGGREQTIPLTIAIVPDACDVEAGEWFDTQGSGIYRANGGMVLSRALIACGEAVERYPDHPRFRFQLGKAQLASDDPEAEQTLKQAADMGHMRAWHRLGVLYLEQGKLRQARQAFEAGLKKWEPASAIGLANLLLSSPSGPQDTERAWDLLSYGVDFGMCDAMTVVQKVKDKASKGDPWAQRFAKEADIRNASCQRDGHSRGTLWLQIERDGSDGDGGGGGYSPG